MNPGIFVYERGTPQFSGYVENIGPNTYHGETQTYADILNQRKVATPAAKPVFILIHHSTQQIYTRPQDLYPESNDFINIEFTEDSNERLS